ncbi:MAG: aminotransferase class I/II-fold pyridoxal phosphate-dependent enzyme [Pseudomonadota bacterium]
MIQLSDRSRVEPFHAMDVLAAANERKKSGVEVGMLCVGQPGALAPRSARDAAAKLLETGPIGYTDANGIAALRERLARHYEERYCVNVDPARIFITTGSSAAFNLAFLALFNAGDGVAIACPGYPAYRNILTALSLKPIEIETGPADRHTMSADLLAKAFGSQDFAGTLVASPANPSGTMMTPDALRDLCHWCDANDRVMISDEIYHGLTYEADTGIREATALQFSQNAIIINSFSKYFCMTGWRIGWMVLPEPLVRTFECLSQSLYISPPSLSQTAALHALDATDELEEVKEVYRRNRALMLTELPRLGFKDILPVDGAFYAYADTSALANDSFEFAYRMLNEANVAATPGKDFDPVSGHNRMRLSFAGTEDEIAWSLEQLAKWLG